MCLTHYWLVKYMLSISVHWILPIQWCPFLLLCHNSRTHTCKWSSGRSVSEAWQLSETYVGINPELFTRSLPLLQKMLWFSEECSFIHFLAWSFHFVVQLHHKPMFGKTLWKLLSFFKDVVPYLVQYFFALKPICAPLWEHLSQQLRLTAWAQLLPLKRMHRN